MISTRFSTPEDADAQSACIDAVSRSGGIWEYLGFSAEQTREFITLPGQRRDSEVVAVAEAQIVGWCDVTPIPFEGCAMSAAWGWACCHRFGGKGPDADWFVRC